VVGSPILSRDLGGHSGERRRTYDVVAARLRRAGGFLAGAVRVNLDENPGPVATQTLTFLFADIDGSAAMSRRNEDAYAGELADRHRLLRAPRAAHGAEKVVTRGGEFPAVFASPWGALVSHA
jgi:class 3 adenylate cyclase